MRILSTGSSAAPQELRVLQEELARLKEVVQKLAQTAPIPAAVPMANVEMSLEMVAIAPVAAPAPVSVGAELSSARSSHDVVPPVIAAKPRPSSKTAFFQPMWSALKAGRA